MERTKLTVDVPNTTIGVPWESLPSWTFFTFPSQGRGWVEYKDLIHLRTPEGFVRFEPGGAIIVGKAASDPYRGLLALPFSEAILKR